MSDFLGTGWSFPPRINQQGSVALASEDEDIRQAIWIILSTPIGQRVMRPTFGSRLHELVFAPLNASTFGQAEVYVDEALGFWEPRIEVLTIEARLPNAERDGFDGEDGETMLIDIVYRVKESNDERSLVYPFYRIPQE